MASLDQHRPDGRIGGGTLRPLSAELSCLNRADGSAKFSSGFTQVLAAVYGPATPRNPSRERSGEASLSIVFKHATDVSDLGLPPGYGASVRELERFVGDSLAACVAVEEYPRTVIEIVVQVIKADGSLVGTALNAAVLALMDAGVLMGSLPVTTTCLVESNGGGDGGLGITFDPSAEEEAKDEVAVIVLVTDSVKEDIVLGSMTCGAFQLSSFLAAAEGASRAGKAVVAFWRIAMEQKVTREANTLWST